MHIYVCMKGGGGGGAVIQVILEQSQLTVLKKDRLPSGTSIGGGVTGGPLPILFLDIFIQKRSL